MQLIISLNIYNGKIFISCDRNSIITVSACKAFCLQICSNFYLSLQVHVSRLGLSSFHVDVDIYKFLKGVGNCIGARNHKFFIGFLVMLIIMCSWMLYGGCFYYTDVCDVNYEDGLWAALTIVSACTPWIGWVMLNASLHFIWVTILLICQQYQIICLGMTTNERMNRDRWELDSKEKLDKFLRYA